MSNPPAIPDVQLAAARPSDTPPTLIALSIPSPADLPSTVLHRVPQTPPRRLRVVLGARTGQDGLRVVRAAISYRGGDVEVVTATAVCRVASDAIPAQYQVLVDLLPHLHAHAGGHPIELALAHRPFTLWWAEHRPVRAGVALRDAGRPEMLALMRETIPLPVARTTRTPGPAPLSPRFVIATDASMRRFHPGAGIAAVSARGRHVGRFRSGTSSILVAELEAMALALESFPQRRILLLSDSKLAVEALTLGLRGQWYSGPADAARVVARIIGKVGRRDIEVAWVKGHDGHPLNECADRLSRLYRRAATCDPSHVTAIAARICAETLADHQVGS